MRKKFILHFIFRDKFTSGYINFMKIYMKSWNHFFLTTESKKYPLNTIDQENFIVMKNCDQLLFDPKVLDLVYECDQFIISGAFGINYAINCFNDYVLKKTYIHFWGADFYAYKDFARREVLQTKQYMGNILSRCRGAIVLLDEDYDELKKVFPGANRYLVAPMPEDPLNTLDLDKYTGLEGRSGNRKGSRRILVGNSATKTNQHIEVYQWLSDKDMGQDQVEVYSSLSYGDADYRNEVIKEGKLCFGKKFKPVTELMDLQAYLDYLYMMDVGVFNNNRQQGLGNIFFLLDMGKKVYVRKDVPTWKLLKRLGYKVFDTAELESQTMAEVLYFNSKDRKHNIYLGKKRRLRSFDKISSRWEKVFQDVDPNQWDRKDAIKVIGEMIPGQDKESRAFYKCMTLCNIQDVLKLSVKIDIIRVMEGHTPTVLPNISVIDLSKDVLNTKYVIFGTGKHGENCYKFFKQMHLGNRIKCFWDNDRKKVGNPFHDIMVERPNEGYCSYGIKIIIASVENTDAMLAQVQNLGYPAHQIYTFRGILQKLYRKFIEENYPTVLLQLIHRNYTNYNK